MLNIGTRYSDTTSMDVVSTLSAITEGTGLILTQEDGVQKVSNGTGIDAEICVGIALLEYTNAEYATIVEQVTAPAGGGDVTLGHTPTGTVSNVRVVEVDGSISVNPTAAVPTATGEVQLVGSTISFHVTDANRVFDVTYRYALSVVESQELTGDGVSGRSASAVTQTVTVVRKGTIETDQFDTGVDWSADNITGIKVGAGGIIQLGGTGATLTAYVTSIPTGDSPFLGLYINQ